MILDLSNLQSVVDFVKNWGDKRVDILINNAGIMQCPYNLSSQGYEFKDAEIEEFLFKEEFLF